MILQILKVLGILLEVVLLFNLLIVVHELGHFLAAKWRGLKVEKFAVWFGKPLWSKTIGGVEYRLGSIPAGGFVAIPQLAPMEAIEGHTDEKGKDLPPARPLDKIIVAAAGPAASMGLAFCFAFIVWGVGRPVREAETTNRVGYVIEGGAAAKAGILPGDRILAVNGHPVSRINGLGRMSDTVAWNVAVTSSPVIPIRFERNGREQVVEVEPVAEEHHGWGRKNLRQIGIIPASTPLIARIIRNSPAEMAGLRGGDLVVAADGRELFYPAPLAELILKSGGQPVTLTIRRGGSEFPVTVTPRVPEGQNQPRIGVEWDERGLVTLRHPDPLSQIKTGLLSMWETISAVTDRRSEVGVQQLSGPVGIMRLYYILFQSPMGWQLALWFSVVLNVNLAVMNLLPLPVLDGGHILLALIEWACGHPIHQRTLEIVQTGFAMLLIGAMLYISFFDLGDLVTGHKAGLQAPKAPEAMIFAAPSPVPPKP